jgi:isocitrate dehydrogenase
MWQASKTSPTGRWTGISISQGKLVVPDHPILPFIEVTNCPDIWRAEPAGVLMHVQKAYGGRRKIAWMEVYAGKEQEQVRQLAAR